MALYNENHMGSDRGRALRAENRQTEILADTPSVINGCVKYIKQRGKNEWF